MAYYRRHRIAFLIASMTTALVAAFSHAADTWSTFTDNVSAAFHSIDWPDFIPTASQSIDLDRATRELVDHRQPGIASRFKSFLDRAILHDDFSAGHFDPGRMPA